MTLPPPIISQSGDDQLKAINFIDSLLAFIDTINHKVGRLTSFFIVGMLVPILFEIVQRYILNKPTLWAHELSTFFFGASWVLGAGYTFLLGGHVNMDIFYNKCTRRKKAVLDIITFVATFIFCFFMLKESIELAIRSWSIKEISESLWAPPLYPIKTILPIGVLLLLLQSMAKFIRDVGLAITGREVFSPPKYKKI